MSRKRWAIATAAVGAAAAIAVGAWAVSQVLAEDAQEPDRPVDTRAPDADPDEWDEDRMENATPAPMPTVD